MSKYMISTEAGVSEPDREKTWVALRMSFDEAVMVVSILENHSRSADQERARLDQQTTQSVVRAIREVLSLTDPGWYRQFFYAGRNPSIKELKSANRLFEVTRVVASSKRYKSLFKKIDNLSSFRGAK